MFKINNEDSARMATEYLYQKGHRKIGYIRSSFRIRGFRSRFYGYQSALRKFRLDFDEKNVFTVTPNLNGAYHDMLRYLEKRSSLPTAFFADNDLMALGSMKAFQEKGYRIPEDISIIGFDDINFCTIYSPTISTVHVNKLMLGKMALSTLQNMTEIKDFKKVKIRISGDLKIRQSTK